MVNSKYPWSDGNINDTMSPGGSSTGVVDRTRSSSPAVAAVMRTAAGTTWDHLMLAAGSWLLAALPGCGFCLSFSLCTATYPASSELLDKHSWASSRNKGLTPRGRPLQTRFRAEMDILNFDGNYSNIPQKFAWGLTVTLITSFISFKRLVFFKLTLNWNKNVN